MQTWIFPCKGLKHFWILMGTMVALLLSAGAAVWAHDYYFSAEGNDATGNGSRAAPWQSIEKLNTLNLIPGDRVFFRAGDTFEGPIVLNANASATDASGMLRGIPILFGSFGRGERPVIASPHDHGLHAVDVGGIEIRNLEFVGSSVLDEITDVSNTTNGLLFENTQGHLRQHHIVIDGVVVHGFGEAGIHFRAVNPMASAGGFANVQVTHSVIHTNGRSGVLTSVKSDTGLVVDGSLFDFQSRAHANFYVNANVVHHTTGKDESGGVSGNGVVLPQMTHARIEFNVAHHNGGVAGGGGVAIWTWESDNVIIQWNEAYNSGSFDGRDGEGFDLDGGTRYGVLQYNYSHGNFGPGYGLFQFGYASPMQGNIIRYNISEDDGGGIGIWGSGPRFDGTNVVDLAAASLAYNNTFVHPQGPGANFFGAINNVGVYNTIFLSSGRQALVQRTDFGPLYPLDFELLYNAYWSGDDPMLIVWDDVHYSSLADWATATQQEMVGGALVGVQHDPGLRGPFTGGRTLNQPLLLATLKAYRLLPTSVLIDAGGTVAHLPVPMALGLTDVGQQDFYGSRIPQGPHFDIGAHERRQK